MPRILLIAGNRGRFFLFTSHALFVRDHKWDFGFNPHRAKQWGPKIDKLAKLRMDYVFPGYTGPDEEVFYRLDDPLRKSLPKALRAKLKSG